MLEQSKKDENIALTKGYNMAFGALSKRLLVELRDQLIDTLIENSLPRGKESDDAETRRQAVKSLIRAVTTLGPKNIDLERLQKVLETLYKALDDYALDRRGDVGSWVREESMKALTQLVQLMVELSQDKEDMEAQGLVEGMGADKAGFYETYVKALL